MKYKEDIYLDDNGEKFYGEKLPVILYVNDQYMLTYIVVFKNGFLQTFWGLITIEQLKDKVKEGKLLQNIPNNIELEVEELGTIQSLQFTPEKSDVDFIKEIEDLINEFNNRITRSTICEKTYKTYLLNPTANNLANLKDKYNDLPSHKKVLFEYIDVKDPLCKLMKQSKTYTFEERKELLKRYFKIELSK